MGVEKYKSVGFLACYKSIDIFRFQGEINAIKYRDILEASILDYLWGPGDKYEGILFMHDHKSYHTSSIVTLV